MLAEVMHYEVAATLAWLKTKDPALAPMLERSFGYAVFPVVGRAGMIVGGARGEGEVFAAGRPIGLAKLDEITVGLTVGGETFSEVVLFGDARALDAFKRRGISFTATASAVMAKAGAVATSGATRRAYSRGGLLLEASVGGQRFRFVEESFPFLHDGEAGSDGARRRPISRRGSEARDRREQRVRERAIPAAARSGALEKEPRNVGASTRKLVGAAASRGARLLKSATAGTMDIVTSMLTKDHLGTVETIKYTLAGLGDEGAFAAQLEVDVDGALGRMTRAIPELDQVLDQAHAYAVFPAVAKASVVVGGAYGRGEVFERSQLIGYAAIVQMTVGMQLGGQTFDELLAFDDAAALQHFERGKLAFTANASLAIVKAGMATTSDYARRTTVYVRSEGGLILETAIGGQKFVFRPTLGRR